MQRSRDAGRADARFVATSADVGTSPSAAIGDAECGIRRSGPHRLRAAGDPNTAAFRFESRVVT
ncbi:hypothetical protein DB771_27730 [Burkholderia sp. AU29985]|nr:hypothetical protein BDSB_10585 [Burkholderia dolosa PC543]PUA73676.1 hypothetical protein DB771_27730 [Burkholderia sp. AU29985]